MGYKNNKKNNSILKSKISNLEIHNNFREVLSVSKRIHLNIKKYFSAMETIVMLYCLYGESSTIIFDSIKQINRDNDLSVLERDICKYFNSFADKEELFSFLSAYYQGIADFSTVNLKPENFILNDLNDLSREQIGYIFYKIRHKEYLSNNSILQKYGLENISIQLMKDALLNDGQFRNKFKEIKRPYEIDSILS